MASFWISRPKSCILNAFSDAFWFARFKLNKDWKASTADTPASEWLKPSAPRGVPQIEVTFDIDANGIVNVSAKDKGTGKEQKIQIQASGGLSEDEINKMVKEAEANKEADKKKRESVDARNQADTLLHSTEKNLKEHGSKVSEADKKAIETASANLRNALKGTDIEDIKKKTQDLVQSSMKLGEAIYKSQQSAKPGDAPKDKKEEGKKDDNVVDADFEEVKDDNKEKSA